MDMRFTRLLLQSFAAIGLAASLVQQIPPAMARSIQFVPPQTDENSDPSDRPRGGGSRPICHEFNTLTCIQSSMVALVPPSNATGLTLSATPRLWFFSPYETTESIQASFELVDSQGQIVWQASKIPLVSQPSIFSYQIPSHANLRLGETYRWYLTVHLDPDQPATDVLLSARLIYQAIPEFSSATETSSLAHIQRLADRGIWYDMVTALAQMDSIERSLWESFLVSHGFPELVQYPIHW